MKRGEVMNASTAKTELEASEELSLEKYDQLKDRYLILCRKHALNPFDLCIVNLIKLRLPHRDRIELTRLIIRLIKLERMLKDRINKRLFPLTVEASEKSGYLVAGD